MFQQTGGLEGIQGKEIGDITKVLGVRISAPSSVFGVIPFNDDYSSGSNFSDVLASRFRNLENVIAERRHLEEMFPEDPIDLMTPESIEAVKNDVAYAVNLLFSEDQFINPVEQLWEKNNYHGVHCVDVSLASLLIAAGSSDYHTKDELITVGVAALLHDIGKEKYVLLYTKLGAFNEDDHRLMKQHPKDSVEMVRKALRVLPRDMRYGVLRGIEEHHENWDGSGYYGLKKDQISKPAQIIRIADSMESGTSIVRAAMYNGVPKTREQIMVDISGKSGTFYSPLFVNVLQDGFDHYQLNQLNQHTE